MLSKSLRSKLLMTISDTFRSSIEAREKPSNLQHISKKCVLCGKIKLNGMRKKFTIFQTTAHKFFITNSLPAR